MTRLSIAILVFWTQLASLGVELRPGTTIRFATPEEGRARLGGSSEFSRAMTPLDRMFSLGVERATSEADYLAYAARQALRWSAAETNRFMPFLERIRTRLGPYALRLPPEIYLIKTTGNESFGGSYTGADYIAWAPEPISPFGGLLTEWILTHEIFHVLSRYNPGWRRSLYRAFGFFHCGDVAMPEAFRALLVTNPDALDHRFAIELRDSACLRPAIPLLYYRAASNLVGRSIQDFANLDIFELEQQNGHYALLLDGDGRPKRVSEAARQDYHRKTGNNTAYVIHPEEIAAENFALLSNPQGWAVDSPRVLHLLESALLNPRDTGGLPAGWFHGRITALSDASLIQFSSDLRQWSNRETLNPSFTFTDPEAWLAKQRFYRTGNTPSLFLTPGSTNHMRWIAPGTIESSDGETPGITAGFWIGVYEVTQHEYQSVMGANPSVFVDSDAPVESIDWNEANDYCAKLTERARARGQIPDTLLYRLPTEAEWRYAFHAGNYFPLFSGNNSSAYQIAWFSDNSDNHPHTVGLKLPTPSGLHDMAGNIAELCADILTSDDSETAPTVLVRGGSFQSIPRHLVVPSAEAVLSVSRSSTRGFRIVLAPPI